MSCQYCFNAYSDETNKCFNICENGHTSCRTCFDNLRNKCPVCNLNLRNPPLLTRINNEEINQRIQQPIMNNNTTVVLLIDTSGSMSEISGETGSPRRIELVGHMMKIMLKFCNELNKECIIYTFNSDITKLPITKSMSENDTYSIIEKLTASNFTNLGLALNKIYNNHHDNTIYFVFTDGDSSDDTELSVKLFDNTQLHLLSFSKDVKTNLLDQVTKAGRKHTISYIQNIDSLMGYMIPIFVYAMTDTEKELDVVDDNLRREYVDILEPQINGSTAQYNKNDLIVLLKTYYDNLVVDGFTEYLKDLKIDTVKNKRHGRIHFSFENEIRWNNFGRFYIRCILHCHKYKIPGNAFDVSLKHYKTNEYNEIYNILSGKADSIPFVSFTESIQKRANQSAIANKKVLKTVKYVDCYSTSTDDDGCIDENALIQMKMGSKKVKDLKIFDEVSTGIVKWIIKIYNGLTKNHPVYINDQWIPAKQLPNAIITVNTVKDVVYDIVLSSQDISHVIINDINTAVVGYPIPGMIHPYWGSNIIIEQLKEIAPNGGLVEVNGKDFIKRNGIIENIFKLPV
jgi:hypothetical protein